MNLFGKIILGSVKTDPYMEQNELGYIANEELNNISNHFEHIRITDYVIMPNHLHFIINVGVGLGPTL